MNCQSSSLFIWKNEEKMRTEIMNKILTSIFEAFQGLRYEHLLRTIDDILKHSPPLALNAWRIVVVIVQV